MNGIIDQESTKRVGSKSGTGRIFWGKGSRRKGRKGTGTKGRDRQEVTMGLIRLKNMGKRNDLEEGKESRESNNKRKGKGKID